MLCPLCSVRKARRACPALGHQICTVCCATKRQTEIRCPPDCVYLAAAREHPPAATVRRRAQDLALLVEAVRDLDRRQADLLLGALDAVARYQPPDLQSLVDEDLIEAAAALAATLETSARGIIYEHRPGTRAAEALASRLRAVVLDGPAARRSTAFERDAAVVLRRVETSARAARDAHDPRAYLKLVSRLARGRGGDAEAGPADPAPRLIVP